MQRKVLQILTIVLVACPAVGLAQAPKDGVYFTAEDHGLGLHLHGGVSPFVLLSQARRGCCGGSLCR